MCLSDGGWQYKRRTNNTTIYAHFAALASNAERRTTIFRTERAIKSLHRLDLVSEGKLTTSKYAKLAKCSQDTAYRDVLGLVERGALKKDALGGRSTSYSLVLEGQRLIPPPAYLGR